MERVLLIAALLIGTGCQSLQTTRALGSLQAEYGDLVRTEDGCDSGELQGDVCLADFSAMYGFIENQAAAAIAARPAQQTPGEQQITIALHRLAAFAALKSHSGQAAAHGAAGRALCDALAIKPPRDCALLEVVGQYEVVNAYAADVQCLRDGASGCARGFESLSDAFCEQVFEPLRTRTGRAKSQYRLPAGVVAYLDAQPRRAITSQRALAECVRRALDRSGGEDCPHF